MLIEETLKEEDIDEMSGASAAVGYQMPLGAKPPRIKDPGGKGRKGRRSPAKAAGSAFGGAKPVSK